MNRIDFPWEKKDSVFARTTLCHKLNQEWHCEGEIQICHEKLRVFETNYLKPLALEAFSHSAIRFSKFPGIYAADELAISLPVKEEILGNLKRFHLELIREPAFDGSDLTECEIRTANNLSKCILLLSFLRFNTNLILIRHHRTEKKRAGQMKEAQGYEILRTSECDGIRKRPKRVLETSCSESSAARKREDKAVVERDEIFKQRALDSANHSRGGSNLVQQERPFVPYSASCGVPSFTAFTTRTENLTISVDENDFDASAADINDELPHPHQLSCCVCSAVLISTSDDDDEAPQILPYQECMQCKQAFCYIAGSRRSCGICNHNTDKEHHTFLCDKCAGVDPWAMLDDDEYARALAHETSPLTLENDVSVVSRT
jgi:hypothetical protein